MRLGRGRVDRPLTLLAAIAFVVQIGVSVMLPLLPLYAVSLGATPFMLGLLTSSFAVANTLGGLSAGFLAERFQPRRLVAGGLGFYAVANVLIATATAAIPLIGFRTLSGFGGGLAFTADRLYLTSIVDRSRLAASNGILSAAGSAGSLIGPVAGGLLAAAADVRLPFLLVGLTSLIGALAALFRHWPGGLLVRPAGRSDGRRAPDPGLRRDLIPRQPRDRGRGHRGRPTVGSHHGRGVRTDGGGDRDGVQRSLRVASAQGPWRTGARRRKRIGRGDQTGSTGGTRANSRRRPQRPLTRAAPVMINPVPASNVASTGSWRIT
jgi:hypothetical protein